MAGTAGTSLTTKDTCTRKKAVLRSRGQQGPSLHAAATTTPQNTVRCFTKGDPRSGCDSDDSLPGRAGTKPECSAPSAPTCRPTRGKGTPVPGPGGQTPSAEIRSAREQQPLALAVTGYG